MADKALNEFLDAYDTYRVKDQLNYYSDREKEYAKADAQAGGLTEVLLFLAGVSGVVAVTWPQYALWLGVVAATLAAMATVIGGWAELIGFSKNAQMFRATEDRLARERPDRPSESAVRDDEARAYLEMMEDILLSEVLAWGKEWKKADEGPPASN